MKPFVVTTVRKCAWFGHLYHWALPLSVYTGPSLVDVTVLCFTFRYIRGKK